MQIVETEAYENYVNTEEELKNSIIYEEEVYRVRKVDNEIVFEPYFMVLIDRNIYFYDNKTDKKEAYTGSNSLISSFIRVNSPEQVRNETIYSFSIFLQDNKQKKFYQKDNEIVKTWVKRLREAINYRNIFDYYQIVSTLGEGQYGKVTKGLNKEKKEVAIKIIEKKKIKDSEVWNMIRTEIDILKISKHPNIVKFIDNFENSEFIFIIMEYIQSGTLHEIIKTKALNLNEKAVAGIAYQLADALKYLHKYGIIHRDLKPENIMIQEKSIDLNNIVIKIADFGFGKILGKNERAQEGYGSLAFAAPEILTRIPYNNSVDIWSFGIIVYYMLENDVPFRGRNKDETYKFICEKELYFPKRFRDLSEEILDLIYGCLLKPPNKRNTVEKILNHSWFKKYNL